MVTHRSYPMCDWPIRIDTGGSTLNPHSDVSHCYITCYLHKAHFIVILMALHMFTFCDILLGIKLVFVIYVYLFVLPLVLQ